MVIFFYSIFLYRMCCYIIYLIDLWVGIIFLWIYYSTLQIFYITIWNILYYVIVYYSTIRDYYLSMQYIILFITIQNTIIIERSFIIIIQYKYLYIIYSYFFFFYCIDILFIRMVIIYSSYFIYSIYIDITISQSPAFWILGFRSIMISCIYHTILQYLVSGFPPRLCLFIIHLERYNILLFIISLYYQSGPPHLGILIRHIKSKLLTLYRCHITYNSINLTTKRLAPLLIV